MDGKLLSWGMAVKSRRRKAGLQESPVLWLFTDRDRLPDPCAAARLLPKGLCGIVLRHDSDPNRAKVAQELAAISRDRRLILVIAGDWRLAARFRAGWHLREGKAPARAFGKRRVQIITSSAHGASGLRRAKKFGCHLVFLSPLLPTPSHPGSPALGGLSWLRQARLFNGGIVALGGIDGDTVVRVPRKASGVAGISAFAAKRNS